MFFLISGLPGSGKSSCAELLANKIDATIINTDYVRDQLFPNKETTKTGDFTAEQISIIYRCLCLLANYLASNTKNKHFIFEGTFRSASQRDAVKNEIINSNQKCYIIHIAADELCVKQRITERFEKGIHAAQFMTYMDVKLVYEEPLQSIFIENSGSIDDLSSKIDTILNSIT